MAKLHVSLDDRLVQMARVQAAQEGTTVPKLIARIIHEEKVRLERRERMQGASAVHSRHRDGDDPEDR